MDICVLSTFTEGISNAILEYMALEKPVIATDGGGTNEIVENEKTGFLIPQKNPSALAEKLDVLLNDKDLRIKMGKAGREQIERQFSIENMVGSYIESYTKLIN